ncbi:MAG: winged helix-turn-helix domain-containing protein [Planctomycetes bacterium]|nr:winged helix-turn-helix domain-containing protein [Planctomycetota bacterium]
MEKKNIEIGKVYSAKYGGTWLSVRIDKSLGHGRYEGTSLPSGKVVITSTDAIRGDGQSEEQWKASRAPKTHDLPVPVPPPAAKIEKPKAEKKKQRGPSGLDSAAKVLGDAKGPLNTAEIVKRMLDRGLWKTNGKTPAATIYAAICREIKSRGPKSRFKKTDKGMFTLTSASRENA